jgi:hypothetical protein
MMNKRGIGFLSIIIFLVVTVGGGIAADTALKNTIGLGLLDIFNLLGTLGQTSEELPSLEEVSSQLTIESYNDYLLQRGNITILFTSLGEGVEQLNSNPEITDVFKAAFGENYKVYMFTVANVGDLKFKVFEWSLQLSNGNVTVFQAGKTFTKYDVYVQLSQSVAQSLFEGDVNSDQVIAWVKEGMIKIKPITFVLRFANAIPQITTLMQQHVEIK